MSTEQLTMIATLRYCDGSHRTATFVGYRNELGTDFGHFLPTATSVREGVEITVRLAPAPKKAQAPRD